MPDIAGISGKAVADVAGISGESLSNIAKFGGITKASSASIRTSDLQIWWEAADGDGGAHPSGSGRRIVNKAHAAGYSSPAIEGDHRLLNGSSSNWTTVGGVDAILLDGSNDNILTRQLYHGNDWFSESLGSSNIFYHQWYDQHDNGDGWTVEIWVKAFNNSWQSSSNIWSAYQNQGFRLRTSSSGNPANVTFVRIYDGTRETSWNPTESIPADEWVHLCLTVDPGNQFTLYENGGSASTNSTLAIDPATWTRNTMVIGAYRTSGQEARKFYVGEYRMYDKALSASDVLGNFNATKSTYGIT